MFEVVKLDRISGDLAGLLLVKAQEESGLHHFTIATLQEDRLISIVKKLSEVFGWVIGGSEHLEEADRIKQRSANHNELGMSGLNFFSPKDITPQIAQQGSFDVYPLGPVDDDNDYGVKAQKVVKGYFLMYHSERSRYV